MGGTSLPHYTVIQWFGGEFVIWSDLELQVKNCDRCSLREGAMAPVFGRGFTQPSCVVVGEAPGANEDRLGLPFVGRSGQLLSKFLQMAQLDENKFFITNLVKCRPPSNRRPKAAEIDCCQIWLYHQLKLLKPKLIITLGSTATEFFWGEKVQMARCRGQMRTMKLGEMELTVMPLFHPAYILRQPTFGQGRPATLMLNDLMLVEKILGGEKDEIGP